MARDLGKTSVTTAPKAAVDLSEGDIAAWLATLPPAPGVRSIDDPDRDDERRALADYDAGRFHDHALVSRWLLTVGNADYRPFKDWLALQNG